jgi:competence protein ComFA
LLAPKYYFYLAVGPSNQSRVDISANPRVDAYWLNQWGYHEMYILRPPQPIWIAAKILPIIKSDPAIESDKFFKLASKYIRELGPLKANDFILSHQLIADFKLPEFDLPDLESLFWGRNMLGGEVLELIKTHGYNPPWDPEDWLQYLWLQGKIMREAAINIDSLGIPVCRRCGSTSGIIETSCLFCGSNRCWTCSNCQAMGISKSCTPLYYQRFPEKPYLTKGKIDPALDFELTPPQQRAALELEKFIDTGINEFLVWAVCGAGKTEVSFQAIAKSLAQGWRILYAIPRRDVVVELGPRFQKAFPAIDMAVIYGGSNNRFNDTPVTIATTHQCLRFFERFDLVILDEADAYPYQGSAMLHYAVKRSLKRGGRLIVMTATPDDTQIKRARTGEIPFISIPARYHRRPLVVPELIKLELNQTTYRTQNWKPPVYIRDFLWQRKTDKRRVLIFLPTLKIIDELGKALINWASNYGIQGVLTHSKCVDRELSKMALSDGELDFLVTSTILERGITIPAIDVLVLFADNEMIFNHRTLIQIAGRAGRMGEPATVVFAGKTITKSMKQACRVIIEMNREAQQLGYLDSAFEPYPPDVKIR